MALFNHDTREVNAKIVYAGPGHGGKETSLTQIYRSLPPEQRSSLRAMTVQGDRVLFFDFRPSDDTMAGYRVRFHLYAAVADVLDRATWKSVLRGADGVVFVADSDPDRQEENLKVLNALAELLAAGGGDIDGTPLVLQYNRRDLAGAVPLEELQRSLNRANVPGFPTVASTGEGVQTTLSCLTRMVLARIGETLEELVPLEVPLPAETGAEAEVQSGQKALPETCPEDIRMEISGHGALDGGKLTIPVTVTAGGGSREFRLLVSLAGVEPDEG